MHYDKDLVGKINGAREILREFQERDFGEVSPRGVAILKDNISRLLAGLDKIGIIPTE